MLYTIFHHVLLYLNFSTVKRYLLVVIQLRSTAIIDSTKKKTAVFTVFTSGRLTLSRRLREIWFTQDSLQFPAFLELYRGWDLAI